MDSQRQKIINLVREIYAEQEEDDLMSLVNYFENETHDEKIIQKKTLSLNILTALIHDRKKFEFYADSLIKRIKAAEKLRKDIRLFSQKILRDEKDKLSENVIINAIDKNRNLWIPYFSTGLLLCNELIDVTEITNLASKGFALIPFLHIPYEIFRSSYLWYYNQISGNRAYANFMKMVLNVSIEYTFAFLGLLWCDYGYDGFIYHLIKLTMANSLGIGLVNIIENYFDSFYALEDAYKYINVPFLATDTRVVAAIKKQALIYRPDKMGDGTTYNDFCKFQAYVNIIRKDRGKNFSHLLDII